MKKDFGSIALTLVGAIAGMLLCNWVNEKSNEKVMRDSIKDIGKSCRMMGVNNEHIICVEPDSDREQRLINALKYAKGKFAVRLGAIWGTTHNVYVFESQEDLDAVWDHM